MELFKRQVWINFLGLLPGSLVTVLVIAIAFLRFYGEQDFQFLSIVASPSSGATDSLWQPSWLHWLISALSGTVEIARGTLREREGNREAEERDRRVEETEREAERAEREARRDRQEVRYQKA